MTAALRALALSTTLVLSACASLDLVREQFDFELNARIAVRWNDEASSANLAWRHGGAWDELLITSPLGQGVARIVRDAQTVTITTADGREVQAEDAEALTEQVLGFRLPVAGLSDWVRARAAPGPAQLQRSPDGTLRSLEQAGWRVEYLAYGSAPDAALPRRLTLYYPGLELRLAISEWRLAP